MKIIQAILTENPCYKVGRKITVKGLMLHSVGCPQPDAMVFIRQWNPPADGREVCVHGFIDANTGDVYQTLPWNHRGWHSGKGQKGAAHDTHIGVEMCEPDCIKYTHGANFTCSDLATARAMVQRTYDNAVALFAHLCHEFNLDPLADGVIISHAEGHARGIASGHADPEHLWKGLGMGYTMDTFRKAVSAVLGGVSAGDDNTQRTFFRVQCGAYSVRQNAENQLAKVKAAGFSDAFIAVVDNRLFRVQVGAFTNRDYAEKQLEKVKAAGFSGFITTLSGKVTSTNGMVVGSTVRVKDGAKDYNGGSLASFVYGRHHTVKSISGDRVVITYDGIVIAAVHKDNLILL